MEYYGKFEWEFVLSVLDRAWEDPLTPLNRMMRESAAQMMQSFNLSQDGQAEDIRSAFIEWAEVTDQKYRTNAALMLMSKIRELEPERKRCTRACWRADEEVQS